MRWSSPETPWRWAWGPRELPWGRGDRGRPSPSPRRRQVCLKYYEYEFMELACQCPAVVCCRCAPTQKAQIVRLLQERTGRLTCAVGRPAAAPAHLRGAGPTAARDPAGDAR